MVAPPPRLPLDRSKASVACATSLVALPVVLKEVIRSKTLPFVFPSKTSDLTVYKRLYKIKSLGGNLNLIRRSD